MPEARFWEEEEAEIRWIGRRRRKEEEKGGSSQVCQKTNVKHTTDELKNPGGLGVGITHLMRRVETQITVYAKICPDNNLTPR
jgi:hypothetical protein